MAMKFKSAKALRAEFGNAASIVQVRVITKMNSTIDVEGPVTTEDAARIVTLALGRPAPDAKGVKSKTPKGGK